MTRLEIALTIVSVIALIYCAILSSRNINLKAQIEGEELQIRYLKERIEKDANIQLLYKVLHDLDTIKKERNDLKELNYLLDRELKFGIPKSVNDPSFDAMYFGLKGMQLIFPPCNGKTLFTNEIRQQHFNDIVSKMKSDVEERFMNEDSSSKPTESKCEDTQPCESEKCCEKPKEGIIHCICGSDEFIQFRESSLVKEDGVAPFYTTSLQCVKCGKVHDLTEKVSGYQRYQKDFI